MSTDYINKFNIGDRVKFLASPADAGKSKGLTGTVTNRMSPVVNSQTGEIRTVYTVLVDSGQCYYISARSIDLERL